MKILFKLLFLAFISWPGHGQDAIHDHRDDFRMNSVSGEEFRIYISRNITEDDIWAVSMKKFGTFHNLMHEMMSDLARYDGGKGFHFPEFEIRISGGEWTRYREILEQQQENSSWLDFVIVTELMHDRVHQPMYYSMKVDNEMYNRQENIEHYAGPQRAPYQHEEVLPELSDLNLKSIARDEFREIIWHNVIDDKNLHAGMQKMLVFDEMLDDLLQLWAQQANQINLRECRADFSDRITSQQWDQYAYSLDDCQNNNWKAFAKSVSLMQNRINHMMYMLVNYLDSY
jgi:hypothetical protein